MRRPEPQRFRSGFALNCGGRVKPAVAKREAAACVICADLTLSQFEDLMSEVKMSKKDTLSL